MYFVNLNNVVLDIEEEKYPIIAKRNTLKVKYTMKGKRNFRNILCCCIVTLIVWLLTIPFLIKFEFLPKQTWNNKAKTDLVEIIKHNVYIDTSGECDIIMGSIYVNFPNETYSIFELCKKKSFDTKNQCKRYLNKFYPIKKQIMVYYNPENYFDVRLDEKSLNPSIGGIIIFSIVGLLWGITCGFGSCEKP